MSVVFKHTCMNIAHSRTRAPSATTLLVGPNVTTQQPHPLAAHGVERVEQQGAQPDLRRNQEPTRACVRLGKARRELLQVLTRERLQLPQGMVLRHPLPGRNSTEYCVLLTGFIAHWQILPTAERLSTQTHSIAIYCQHHFSVFSATHKDEIGNHFVEISTKQFSAYAKCN